MQVPEQWAGSKKWKLVTGAATAATLGLGALAVAVPGEADEAPPGISLEEIAVVGADPSSGGFVPFDLGATFAGLHPGTPHDSPDIADLEEMPLRSVDPGPAEGSMAPAVTAGPVDVTDVSGPTATDETTPVEEDEAAAETAPPTTMGGDATSVPDEPPREPAADHRADEPAADGSAPGMGDMTVESISDPSIESMSADSDDESPDGSLDSPDRSG